jgi:hypothetical protein
MLKVVRDVKPDGISTYMLNLKEDGDRVFEKTNSVLAKMYDEGKTERELRLVHQHLHSGQSVVWREHATDKFPAGDQACLDKIRGLLADMARERQFNDEAGKVLGTTADEIMEMPPQALEEFRKAVCKQTTGGVQLENKVLYYLGTDNANFIHRAIGKRFKETEAMWKDLEMKRTYWIQFEDRRVANVTRDARRELKTHAQLAETKRKEAAQKKLDAKKKKDAAQAEPATPAQAEPAATVTEGE